MKEILKYKKQLLVAGALVAVYFIYQKTTKGYVVKTTNSTAKPIEAETIELKTVAKK